MMTRSYYLLLTSLAAILTSVISASADSSGLPARLSLRTTNDYVFTGHTFTSTYLTNIVNIADYIKGRGLGENSSNNVMRLEDVLFLREASRERMDVALNNYGLDAGYDGDTSNEFHMTHLTFRPFSRVITYTSAWAPFYYDFNSALSYGLCSELALDTYVDFAHRSFDPYYVSHPDEQVFGRRTGDLGFYDLSTITNDHAGSWFMRFPLEKNLKKYEYGNLNRGKYLAFCRYALTRGFSYVIKTQSYSSSWRWENRSDDWTNVVNNTINTTPQNFPADRLSLFDYSSWCSVEKRTYEYFKIERTGGQTTTNYMGYKHGEYAGTQNKTFSESVPANAALTFLTDGTNIFQKLKSIRRLGIIVEMDHYSRIQTYQDDTLVSTNIDEGSGWFYVPLQNYTPHDDGRIETELTYESIMNTVVGLAGDWPEPERAGPLLTDSIEYPEPIADPQIGNRYERAYDQLNLKVHAIVGVGEIEWHARELEDNEQ